MATAYITGVNTSFVKDDSIHSNFSHLDYFGVGQNSVGAGAWGYIKFPWGDNNVPKGANVTSARVELYCLRNYTNQSQVPLRAYPVSGHWNVSTITWNNQPYGEQNFGIVGFYARAGSWTSFSATDWAQRIYQNGATGLLHQGFRLTAPHWTLDRVDFSGASRSSKPRLIVNYVANRPWTPSANPSDSDHTSITVAGGGVNQASTIRIFYSNTISGNYQVIGNATISNGSTYRFVDNSLAPPPNQPSTRIASVNDRDVTVDLGGFSQPILRRYYRARRFLSDGTYSTLTDPAGTAIQPRLQRFQLQRRVAGTDSKGNTYPYVNVYDGRSGSYTDRNLDAGRSYIYRSRTQNSQNRWSAWGATSVTIARPNAPTFSGVIVENQQHFKITATDIPAGATPRIYHSNDGVTFQGAKDFPTHGGGTFTGNMNFGVSSPNKPEINTPLTGESHVSLTWKEPPNPALRKYFRVAYVENGSLSHLSTTRGEVLRPFISHYRLQRKLRGQDNQFLQMLFDNQNKLSHTDSAPPKRKNLSYLLTAVNNHGKTSSAWVDSITDLPHAPTLFDPEVQIQEGGSEQIRLSGANRNGAEAIRIYDYQNSSWSYIGDAELVNVQVGEHYNFIYEPTVIRPNIVKWESIRVDSNGVHLKWYVPVNPPSNYSFSARRVLDGIEGVGATAVSATIKPRLTGYRLQRRLTPPTGKESQAAYAWTTLYDSEVSGVISTTYDDLDVAFETSYDYRVVAYNNFGLTSPMSMVKTTSTKDPPPPPPEIIEEVPQPLVSNATPQGSINISSSATTLRLSWNYSDGTGQNKYPQNSYRLQVEYGAGNLLYWNGAQWVVALADVEDARHRADVDSSIFTSGQMYKFTLSVVSSGGTRSADYTWEMEPALFVTSRFDTRRAVKINASVGFDLYRKVTSHSESISYPIRVTWNVVEPLPTIVDDEIWEGGGNTWIHTVFDRDGRPEPYAELDFEKEGYAKTFLGDERGRFTLKIPDDLDPGVYTMRERGPSMAPRTTHNVAVYDAWLIYSHGHRHSAQGPDPIYGITKDQVDDNAGILPSQVQGGQSLADIVDEYGNSIKEGLERHVNTGHGNYVVRGLDYTWDSVTKEFYVRTGTVWEGGSLHEVAASADNFTTVGTKQVYIYLGIVRFATRESPPPDTTPLYNVKVYNAGTELVPDIQVNVEDIRLYHPPFKVVEKNIEPVYWGAENSEDLIHRGRPLPNVIDHALTTIQNRDKEEKELQQQFLDVNRRTERLVRSEFSQRARARETALQLGFASSMRYMYSLLKTEDRLSLPPTRNISAFLKNDELSSLTNLRIENGVAKLPEDWLAGFHYTLRTLRMQGPPAHMIQFTVIYEDIGGSFVDVMGSLSQSGRYFPKSMTPTWTIPHAFHIERELSETELEVGPPKVVSREVEIQQKNLLISTYRAEFRDPGEEAIVEVLIRGGDHPEGVRLHGWFVNVA